MQINDSRPLWVLGQQVSLVTVTQSYSMIDIVAPAFVPGPPPHTHEDCSEMFYVLEGELDVIVEGKTLRLGVGQSAIVPPRTLHTFHNPTGADTRILTVYNPAGFEKFFLDMGVPTGTPDAQGASVAAPIIGRVITEAESYGMKIPPAIE